MILFEYFECSWNLPGETATALEKDEALKEKNI